MPGCSLTSRENSSERSREHRSVAHVRPDTATLFSLVDGVELAPVKNHAARWASDIPVHPDPAHINTPALGHALAGTLADRHAALIRAHGAVLVAESVPAVFIDIVHFTENAETLYRAAALGPVTALSQAEMSSFLQRFDRPRHVAKLWRYYLGHLRPLRRGFPCLVLESKGILTVHGSGFGTKYGSEHFRLVFLPSIEILDSALDKIEEFEFPYNL